MGKVKNEVGNRYGRLIVIKRQGSKNGHAAWLCKCDCGKSIIVDGTHLRNGSCTSCGCFARENSSKIHGINEIGNRYGKLTVIERDYNSDNEHIKWICKCDCGNITSVLSSNLRRGNVKSCGCLKSIGEQNILQLLLDNNILFKKEYWFPNLLGVHGRPLRFDFAIFNDDGTLSHLIEYDGKQHFEVNEYFGGEKAFKERQKNDEITNEYCRNNNIDLIRIKFNDIININKIINK